MTSRHTLAHVVRCSVWAALLVISLPWPLVAAGFAALLFFSTFAFFHDAAHGALALPPLVNDVVLAVTSVPLLMSGHGQRQLHLRHHARPLMPDDMEGEGALQSLWWAALTAPLASVRMRVAAFSAVNARVRPWVALENVLNLLVVLAAALWGSLGVQAAVAMALVLQLTMNAWASHVPHRAPYWLLAIAGRFAWTRSPVVLSLVYHLEHHAKPRLPCANLHRVDDVGSPLLELNQQREQPLPWAQLQPAARPRPIDLSRH